MKLSELLKCVTLRQNWVRSCINQECLSRLTPMLSAAETPKELLLWSDKYKQQSRQSNHHHSLKIVGETMLTPMVLQYFRFQLSYSLLVGSSSGCGRRAALMKPIQDTNTARGSDDAKKLHSAVRSDSKLDTNNDIRKARSVMVAGRTDFGSEKIDEKAGGQMEVDSRIMGEKIGRDLAEKMESTRTLYHKSASEIDEEARYLALMREDLPAASS
jgi:hypothetical protein